MPVKVAGIYDKGFAFRTPKKGGIDKQSLPTQGKCNATQMKKDQLEEHSPLPNVTRKMRTKTQIMSVTVETTHRLPLLTGKIA